MEGEADISLAAYSELIVVYDDLTRGILGSVDSDELASALCLASLNYKFTSLAKHFNSYLDDFNLDLNNLKEHYQLSRFRPIDSLPNNFLTGQWIAQRTLFQHKKYHLKLWEYKVRLAINKNNDFFGNSNVMAFLTEQLSKCRPEQDYYTPAIEEWADIQEVSPTAAYQELQLRKESYGLVYLRSHAIYHRYVRKISMAESFNQIEHHYNEAITDLSLKARI